MVKYHLSTLLFITLLIATSCESNNDVPLEYSDAELNIVEALDVQFEKINTDVVFTHPESMYVIRDSLIIIIDPNRGENVCCIFNTDGREIASFARKGRSATEVLQPCALSISEDQKVAYVYDSMIKKCVAFDLDAVISGCSKTKAYSFSLDKLLESEDLKGNWILNLQVGGEGIFWGMGNRENRLIGLNTNNVVYIYKDYPNIDNDIENRWAVFHFATSFTTSPDKRHLVTGTCMGAILESFKISQSSIQRDFIKAYYKPIFSVVQSETRNITSNAESILGFTTITARNDFFATVVGGKEMKTMDTILFYNYNGDLIGKVKTSICIDELCVDDEGNMYAFAYNKEKTEYDLYKGKYDIGKRLY